MSSSTSAFIGEPPNTERDYYIARGFLRAIGLYDVDPELGYTRAAKKPSPDYTYTSKRPGIITGLTIIIVAIIFVTGTRLILRASVSQMRFGMDDWMTIAAAAFGIAYTACQIVMAIKGGGSHIWDATYEDYNVFNYYGVVDKFLFYLTVGFVKVSLTLFIRRLADRSSKYWKWFCDFFLVTLAIYILLAVFWEVFTCNPPQSQWDKLYAGQLASPATCIPTTVQGNLLNIAHIVQGCILLLSPMVILYSVRIDRNKKIRLFVMWTVGLIAVLCGLMRQLRGDYTSDIMWDYTELLVWTSLDVCVGIITISLPVMDAWMYGAWRGAMTKLGKNYGPGSRGAEARYGHNTTIRGPAISLNTPKKHYADSLEEIIQKNHANDTELNTIVRTDEYNVRFSAAAAESDEETVATTYAKAGRS